MQPPSTCQACQRPSSEALRAYRRGEARVHREALLQCDICERFACAECLEVYDLLSGYDFLCHDCAREILPKQGERGH
jgi:hypothetical protein